MSSKPLSSQALTPNFTPSDYASFFAAGALCCTISHGAMTPIDVVKTRIQIDAGLKGKGLLTAGRSIIAAEGPAGLLTGFGPTAVGYLAQGGAKFAGYEFFKKQGVELAGSHESAVRNRTLIYLGGAAAAEFFADILLTPLEATRIRLVSNPKYASGLLPGFLKIAREEGMAGLYAGFIPILAKQVPYAIGQFATNEFMHELVNKSMSPEELTAMTETKKASINLGCGIIAGFSAAILSNPGDVLLSQINKGHGPEGSMISRLGILAKEAGVRGLFSGLGPRMIMTAGLVSSQFYLYNIIKTSLHTKPGIEIHAD